MNPIHYESISVTWANIILLISLLPIKKKNNARIVKEFNPTPERPQMFPKNSFKMFSKTLVGFGEI